MNLLVTGNGFDLALNLPTRYADFLDFAIGYKLLSKILILNEEKRFKTSFYTVDLSKKNRIHSSNIRDEVILFLNEYLQNCNQHFDYSVVKAFAKCLTPDRKENIEQYKRHKENINEENITCIPKDNIWIIYLSKRYENHLINGENWIDIENEIKYIIQKFEKQKRRNDENKIGTIPSWTELDKIDCTFFSDQQYELFRYILRKDFERLTFALYIYFKYFIGEYYTGEIKNDRVNFLKNKDINYVLSFNYTSYFRKVLKNLRGECFIHGDLNLPIKNQFDLDNLIKLNNIVLGFDYDNKKPWKDEKMDSKWIFYKKFFQRILFGTDCIYEKWLSNTENLWKRRQRKSKKISNYVSHVYFYGHSLDTTDKDILAPILSKAGEWLKITIYYRDEEVHNQLLINLVDLLGVKETIAKTRRASPYIKFECIDEAVHESRKVNASMNS